MVAKKSSGKKYGKAASAKVGKTMHERKKGTLRTGSAGKRVAAASPVSSTVCRGR